MALVFTAVSNGLAALLLRWKLAGPEAGRIDAWLVGATIAVAVGLYGYGMALNDIIDRRRDRQIARTRPLPSGRIGVGAAVIVAGLLLALALAGGFVFYQRAEAALVSLVLVCFTAVLIGLYDYAGKYLVWLGLLMLGLVRFFHASVASPQIPVVWHLLFILNHVVIISAVAYVWEAKRPPLTREQGWTLAVGLAAALALRCLVPSAATARPKSSTTSRLRFVTRICAGERRTSTRRPALRSFRSPHEQRSSAGLSASRAPAPRT